MPRPEIVARIRAARGYADFTQTDLAGALEISESTVKRLEDPKSVRPVKKRDLDAISDATGVPRWFMRGGWTGEEELTGEQRVAAAARRSARG